MFSNPKDLKEFIIWAKSQKLRRLKVKDVEFELSEIAFVDDQINLAENLKETSLQSSKTLVDTEEINPNEEDELLFWSSNK
jgi:hypothetical protein